MPPLDLLLGSDIGLWVLRTVRRPDVARVLTCDVAIAREAAGRGFEVTAGDANAASYRPSELGLSVHYPRLLKPPFIARYRKVYNLHPGYLPWGRGYYPVFWALWERTPAGATLHEIDAAIDGGPIVAQARVEYGDGDTGASLLERVRAAERGLFSEFWPHLIQGRTPAAAAQLGSGSYHPRREFDSLRRRVEGPGSLPSDRERLARCLSYPAPAVEPEPAAGRP